MTDEDALRAAATLRRLGFPTPPGIAWLAPTLALAPVRLPDDPLPTWAVADLKVRHRKPTARPLHPSELVCACGGRTCAHVASVLLAEAEASEPVPMWEALLVDLPGAAPSTSGAFAVDLHRPAPGRVGLEPELLVAADPPRPPRNAAELAAIAQRGPVERELHAALLAIAHARRIERGRPVLVRHLTRSLLGPLSALGRVTLEGSPIRVSVEPLVPALDAAHDEGEGLVLGWRQPVAVVWPDVALALTVEGELRALPDIMAPEVCTRLLHAPPAVPRAEVRRFVDRVVVDQGLSVSLPADVDPLTSPTGRSARLVLSAAAEGLAIALQLAYAVGDVEVVVEPGTGSSAPKPGGGRVRRDPAWEGDAARRFAEQLGDHRVILALDEAIDFLRERLPTLAGSWEIHGEDRLLHLRVHGAATPRVRFDEGVDWFDLDVGFEAGGATATVAEVLASWRGGARYVRLSDGALAELPKRWLERHGHALVDLHEVHRLGRRLSSWHAWMFSDLAAELAAVTLGPGPIRRVEPPAALRATLRPYQRDGLDWLCFLRDHGLHGVLADEMGLGKTVQTLAAILHGPRDLPALVVAPTSVISVWQDEAARFTPTLRVLPWHGAARSVGDLAGCDLVVTSYALLRRDHEVLAQREWSWLVLDEGRHIKNPASLTARAARRLRARHRLVLSGTPLENDLIELWSLFQFLMPGWLGRRSWFHSRYQVAQGRRDQPGEAQGLAELRQRIRPFLLRRRKADVAAELPAKTELIVKVQLSERERRLYDRIRATVRAQIAESRADGSGRASALVLEGLTRLRQACCHPGLLPFPEARSVRVSAKQEALDELVDDAIGGGSRVLVFSQWVRLLDSVAAGFSHRGVSFDRLDGSTVDRRGVVERFQRGGADCLLVSTMAGGTGVTLTAADIVIHLDPWWNPAVEDQASARAHRIGQTRPVTVYRLVAEDTVEERVIGLSEHKRRLFDEVVERTANEGTWTPADLLALLDGPANGPFSRESRGVPGALPGSD